MSNAARQMAQITTNLGSLRIERECGLKKRAKFFIATLGTTGVRDVGLLTHSQ
jgi:hypothetical protein